MKLQLQILFGDSVKNRERNQNTIVFFSRFKPDIFNYSENDINKTRMMKIINFDIISNTGEMV